MTRAACRTRSRVAAAIDWFGESLSTKLAEARDTPLTYARHRVEAAGPGLVGLTYQTATIDPAGTILSLTILDKQHAEPGTAVSVVWGGHPGAGTGPDAGLGFPRIRARVAPAHCDAHARTQYRRS